MDENKVPMPLICMPIVGTTQEEINAEAVFAFSKDPDIVEWRADYFQDVDDKDKVIAVLQSLRQTLPNQAVLFTLRNETEGGNPNQLTEHARFSLYLDVCRSGHADYIDTELNNDHDQLKKLRNETQKHNVNFILSFHDFEQTPAEEQLKINADVAVRLEADYFKFAVMSTVKNDILTVFRVTEDVSHSIQPISMAMGVYGKMTRAASWTFGSKVTFAQGRKSSAPGQMTIEELRTSIDNIRTLV
ncbi:type I 3-dehydroquinate dehydratase [Salisediminibacterium halotolerans]|uniref:3-dehydroquinate dehydratase n=1 Tax=Salisediminibacterium halotolerans TaxID=517425 RepID=A0A1H9S247_9BACI|nr:MULTISPECIES: type I 3-dehydroquinate dehydratase [Salisediminibacterium]RLJ78209.1 3-dehydroquinate dehydratase [Actinophytocola xinjiangensis]RPE88452.1 3-dehydroquinate dehydratase [Salisediminibacterium halotolerans]TWG37186.1 3-dehydroquinate dehydratase [Salisediminibacterium halotolerans]SER78695.1 3-dehydroquinate dehydratase [Salisediminibacterium haloalkalitolerans]GEL07120.1 3-dehydroquinate dehydratase [Salisediminibacterium halotolerans]